MSSGAAARRYHHGNLPEALLEAVAEIVAEQGVEAVSLRAAARRVGVSHAAPTHHFGDKRGLLTAFAARGFARFTAVLSAATVPGRPEDELLACGAAYVGFAVTERHYFDVMFRPELLDWGDPELARGGEAAFGVLLARVAACRGGAVDDPETHRLAVAAWSMVHGLAHLYLDGPLRAGATPPAGVHVAVADLSDVADMADVADVADMADVDAAVGSVLELLRDGLRSGTGWRPDDPPAG